MPTEPEQTPQPPADSGERQLCVNCMFPNELSAHFCTKCGAPMTSYAATGPFEHLFAEGHVYRQAADKPRRFVVVLGVWLIFGTWALSSVTMIWISRQMGFQYLIAGTFLLPVSLVMLWKTTRNYLSRPQVDVEREIVE